MQIKNIITLIITKEPIKWHSDFKNQSITQYSGLAYVKKSAIIVKLGEFTYENKTRFFRKNNCNYSSYDIFNYWCKSDKAYNYV